MTPDLRYLAFTAMLTASLWIPYVVCQVLTNGFLTPSNYVDPAPRPLPLWGKRADRALMNGVEVLGGFAALVIVANLAGKANGMTAMWAATFFWARAVHAVVYWFGIPYIRTIVFTLGYISIAGIFWEIVR
ncbi:MAG: MAPEG family protein [Rhodoferax sp.]|nr:MAPEG family protein [Rhodoferax sp.]